MINNKKIKIMEKSEEVISKLINEIRDRLDILESIASSFNDYEGEIEARSKNVNTKIIGSDILSVRTSNSLRNAGIYSVGDLMECSLEKISSCKNIGKVAIREINDFLYACFEVNLDKGIDVDKYIKTGKIELKEE